MTIALGILASDGLVIAADTQETFPGLWKHEAAKIRSFCISTPGKERACIVTGAGSAHYLDAIGDQLLDCYQHQSFKTPEADTNAQFAHILGAFYRDHVIPLSINPNERPNIELLIGYTTYGQPRLLTSEHTVLKDNSSFATVGMGQMLAGTLLQRVYRGWEERMTVREALALAAYVMAQVKDSVDTCGKNTDMYGFHNGQFFHLDRGLADGLEGIMRRYIGGLEQNAIRDVGSVTDRRVSRSERDQNAMILRMARNVIKTVGL